MAFTFGLMHGLGFAGGLSEAGLPAGHIPTALLFFSIGVETGHFLFIGVVLSLIALVRRMRIPFPRWAELVPPYAIGSVAMFWVIQRVLSFVDVLSLAARHQEKDAPTPTPLPAASVIGCSANVRWRPIGSPFTRTTVRPVT